MKTALTPGFVSRLTFNPGDPSNTYFDETVKGFAVRVYKSGAKRYLVKFMLRGRQKMTVLGDASTMSFEDARRAALETIKAASAGVVEKKVQGDRSVKAFCDEYLRRYSKPRKKTWKLDEGRNRLYIIPALGDLDMDAVTEEHIEDLLVKVGVEDEKPIAANRLHEQLLKMFELAAKWGWYPRRLANPAKEFEPFTEASNERYLTREELRRLFAVLHTKSIYVNVFFSFLVYTGIRKNKALPLKWSDFNWETRLFSVSAKGRGNKKDYYPITEGLERLLKELVRQPDNPYLFCSSRRPGDRMREVNIMWRQIRKEAGIEDVRIHDLRHTMGARLAQKGESLQVIGKCLQHRSYESTLRYAHIADKQSVSAFEGYHEDLAALHISSLQTPG